MKLRRLLLLAASLAFLASGAGAEVCDKVVGESWRPQDGPTILFLNPNYQLAVFLGLFLVIGALLAWRFRLWRTSFVLALLPTALAAFLSAEWLFPNDVIALAVQEGCISRFPVDALIAFALAAAYVVVGIRGRRMSFAQTLPGR